MDGPPPAAPSVAPSAPERLALGKVVLDLGAGELIAGDGAIAPLRRQALDVLLLLGRHAGHVVTKEELMRHVWPRVVVGDGSLTQAIADIRRALGDDEHRILRNVARRGYLLVPAASPKVPPKPSVQSAQSVMPVALADPAPPMPPSAPAAPSHALRRVLPGWAAILVLVALALGLSRTLWPTEPADPLGSAPRASLLVLPFEVEGDAVSQDWLVDSLFSDLTAELARWQGSFVISRDTAVAYRGKAVDPRALARELGVRWVVRGRVRHEAGQLRVSLVLIDGHSGAQSTAKTFSAARAELPQLLDELVLTLRRSIEGDVYRGSVDRVAALSPTQVGADDLAMQAAGLWARGVTRDNVVASLDLLDRALAIDPNSVRASVVLLTNTLHALQNGWVADREARLARMAVAQERLAQLDPEGYAGYQARTIQAYMKGDWPAMLRISEAWVERHRHPIAFGAYGAALLFNESPDAAVAALERALRMSPRDPFRAEWHYRIAFAHYVAGHDALAREASEAGQLANPGLPWPPIHAAVLLRSGDPAAAQQIADDFRARHPRVDRAAMMQRLPADGPRYVAGRERLFSALQELGLL